MYFPNKTLQANSCLMKHGTQFFLIFIFMCIGVWPLFFVYSSLDYKFVTKDLLSIFLKETRNIPKNGPNENSKRSFRAINVQNKTNETLFNYLSANHKQLSFLIFVKSVKLQRWHTTIQMYLASIEMNVLLLLDSISKVVNYELLLSYGRKLGILKGIYYPRQLSYIFFAKLVLFILYLDNANYVRKC